MGKTTQRVAGNVKPTSSGRIRELMINNQQGIGNIITFSALKNNNTAKETAVPNETKIEKVEKSEDRVESTTGSTDTPTLVVRRVGNRDLFTRIRVPKSNQQTSPVLPPKDDTIEKESTLQNEKVPDFIDIKEDSKLDQLASNDVTAQTPAEKEPEFDKDSSVQEEKEEEEVFDFDTILNELNKIQDSNSSNSANSLLDLDDYKMNQENELIRLLKILVTKFREDLSIEEWDLVVRSIYKWSHLITKTDKICINTTCMSFCSNVFTFIHQLILLAKQWEEVDNLEKEFPMMHLLLNDWNNFHSSNVYQDLILLYFKLISHTKMTREELSVIEALANIIIEVDPKLMISKGDLSIKSTTGITYDPIFKLPKNCKYCDVNTTKFSGFEPICNLLNNDKRVVIVTAHAILSKIMDTLSGDIGEANCQDDLDSELSLFPPAPLTSILTSRDEMISALLSDYNVGDISVTIEVGTDAYTCTLSYLLVWDLIIQFIVGLDKETMHKMIHSLKKVGLLQRLLDNIFMLLPPLGEKDSLNFKIEYSGRKQLIEREQSWCLSEFLKAPLKTTIIRPFNEIELIALHLYFSVALHMPVTVRKWFNNNSNKRLCNLVNEYTVKHISQVICSLEMESVQEKCQERANEDKSNNLLIKARPNAREVYTIYTRDEFKMELTIKLPSNYPLGSVHIDGGKRVGVTDLKWRSWLLQLTTFLSHQNGPILDGIDLWRKNIDKRFEGIEKCMICFSILHSNYQLPKKKCSTCTKVFHNLCLYKWFESSGNSTCPLCRNTW